MQKFTYVLIVIFFIAMLVTAFIFINRPLTSSPVVADSTVSGDYNIIEIPYLTDSEYDEKVLNYNGIVLIDFYTDWCYYCKVFSPIIEEVLPDFENIKFYKTNAEVDTNISTANEVSAFPTIVLFEDGVEINRHVGAMPKEQLIKFLKGEPLE